MMDDEGDRSNGHWKGGMTRRSSGAMNGEVVEGHNRRRRVEPAGNTTTSENSMFRVGGQLGRTFAAIKHVLSR